MPRNNYTQLSLEERIIIQNRLENHESMRCIVERPNVINNLERYDNGVEFSLWQQTERYLDATIYFANPYHSWERGRNENT